MDIKYIEKKMVMDIKYIEKKMEKIIPKGVSLLEFMTFGVIVMSTYIFFFKF